MDVLAPPLPKENLGSGLNNSSKLIKTIYRKPKEVD
jgi:hypothetical protein